MVNTSTPSKSSRVIERCNKTGANPRYDISLRIRNSCDECGWVHGLVHAASTRRAARNFRQRSTPCFGGTNRWKYTRTMKDGAFNDGPHSASSLLNHFQWVIALPTSYVPGTYCKQPVFLAGRASRWSHLSLRLNDPAARLASRKSARVLTSWGSDKCYSINRRLKYHRSSPAPQRTQHRPRFGAAQGKLRVCPHRPRVGC